MDRRDIGVLIADGSKLPNIAAVGECERVARECHWPNLSGRFWPIAVPSRRLYLGNDSNFTWCGSFELHLLR
jgi:hypothetical protein